MVTRCLSFPLTGSISVMATIRTTATRSRTLPIRCPNCCLIKLSLTRGLAAECPRTRSASISTNGSRNWLSNIFRRRCCAIIAMTKPRGNRPRTVRWRRICTAIRSRNSKRIIFGQGWMPKLRVWAAATMSLTHGKNGCASVSSFQSCGTAVA